MSPPKHNYDLIALDLDGTLIGPDGAVYVADWYNSIINHAQHDFRDPRRAHEPGARRGPSGQRWKSIRHAASGIERRRCECRRSAHDRLRYTHGRQGRGQRRPGQDLGGRLSVPEAQR